MIAVMKFDLFIIENSFKNIYFQQRENLGKKIEKFTKRKDKAMLECQVRIDCKLSLLL